MPHRHGLTLLVLLAAHDLSANLLTSTPELIIDSPAQGEPVFGDRTLHPLVFRILDLEEPLSQVCSQLQVDLLAITTQDGIPLSSSIKNATNLCKTCEPMSDEASGIIGDAGRCTMFFNNSVPFGRLEIHISLNLLGQPDTFLTESSVVVEVQPSRDYLEDLRERAAAANKILVLQPGGTSCTDAMEPDRQCTDAAIIEGREGDLLSIEYLISLEQLHGIQPQMRSNLAAALLVNGSSVALQRLEVQGSYLHQSYFRLLLPPGIHSLSLRLSLAGHALLDSSRCALRIEPLNRAPGSPGQPRSALASLSRVGRWVPREHRPCQPGAGVSATCQALTALGTVLAAARVPYFLRGYSLLGVATSDWPALPLHPAAPRGVCAPWHARLHIGVLAAHLPADGAPALLQKFLAPNWDAAGIAGGLLLTHQPTRTRVHMAVFRAAAGAPGSFLAAAEGCEACHVAEQVHETLSTGGRRDIDRDQARSSQSSGDNRQSGAQTGDHHMLDGEGCAGAGGGRGRFARFPAEVMTFTKDLVPGDPAPLIPPPLDFLSHELLWGSRSAGLALAPHFVHDHLARVAHALGERAQAGRADTAGSESQGENAEDLCSTSVATDVEQTGEARWVRAAELVRWWGSLGAGEGPDDLVERWRSPACQRQAHPCPWDLEQLQGSPQQKRASEAVTECGEEHGSCARGWGDAGAAAFGRGPQPIDADDGEEWPARGSGRGWDAPACVLEDRIGALSGGGRAAAFAKHEQRAAGDVVVSHKFRLVYVENYKAFSSSIIKIMCDWLGAKTSFNGMCADCCSTSLCLQHTALHGYLFFSFVRDPVARFYSGVGEELKTLLDRNNEEEQRELVGGMRGLLAQIEQGAVPYRSLESQASCLSTPSRRAATQGVLAAVPLDFVGRTSDFERDFRAVVSRAAWAAGQPQPELPSHLFSPAQRSNPGRAVLRAEVARARAEDPELDTAVREAYRQDARCFGFA